MTEFHVSPFIHNKKKVQTTALYCDYRCVFSFSNRLFFLKLISWQKQGFTHQLPLQDPLTLLGNGYRRIFSPGIKRLYREISHSHSSSTDLKKKYVGVNFRFLCTRVCRSCVDKGSYFTFRAILQFKSLIRFS